MACPSRSARRKPYSVIFNLHETIRGEGADESWHAPIDHDAAKRSQRHLTRAIA